MPSGEDAPEVVRSIEGRTVQRDGGYGDVALLHRMYIGPLFRILMQRSVDPVVGAPARIEALFDAGVEEFLSKAGYLVAAANRSWNIDVDDVSLRGEPV